MPLSKDPVARHKQLSNLKPSAARTHGAFSGELIREATAEHLASLTAQFPNASHEELTVQASRMSQIERLTAYVEAKGLIRNVRAGSTYAAADMLAKLSVQFERRHAELAQREREQDKPESIIGSWALPNGGQS